MKEFTDTVMERLYYEVYTAAVEWAKAKDAVGEALEATPLETPTDPLDPALAKLFDVERRTQQILRSRVEAVRLVEDSMQSAQGDADAN